MNFTIDTNIIIAVAGGIVSVSAAYAVVKRSIKNITNKIKDELKKEVAYPSFSDLLIDTEHLLEHMNVYIRRYYESHL